MHSWSIALTRDAFSSLWLGQWILFRCERCFATCPCKNKRNHAKHDIVGKLPRVSKTCESQGKRDTKKSQSSDNWRFDIAMSIPSEDEDCHEDRGSNQLDPCDCGVGGGGGAGGDGGGDPSPYIYIYI